MVSWFGTDLRAGNCQLKPGVENTTKVTTPKSWAVNGGTRAAAHVISLDTTGRTVFGGTPDDASVVQAIQEMKARGLRVTFYPFILMDVPEGNTLPDPYSDNASTSGQPKLPWRGRITCSPAAGYVGTVDKTATAAAQVATFFGSAQVSDFAVSGEVVSWTGGTDWGYRRMILHYAHLCAAAGGVDCFLIGSELVGLTTVRENASTYPAVAALKQLAADVSAILGAGTEVGYAADWSEYFGHQPGDGSGDIFFHLDPLWSDSNIDFVGIDNYLPLSDWRDGFDHLDAQAGYAAVHDRAYLQANIERGERFDWYYASDADRESQTRTTISDGAEPSTFDPLTEFDGGRQGVWFDPADLSTMWQDTAGTIPVTGNEQKVARVDDKSGNGHHAYQSDPARQPTLECDGGGYYLDFEGGSWMTFDMTGAYSSPVAIINSCLKNTTSWDFARAKGDNIGYYVGASLRPDASSSGGTTNNVGGDIKVDGIEIPTPEQTSTMPAT